jgi:hypothetical protein
MKYPAFLKDVVLSPRDLQRLSGPMSNWMTAHAYIRDMEPNERNLQELRLMILHELTNRQRLHMLQRLRARFNSLRTQHEDMQLVSLSR